MTNLDLTIVGEVIEKLMGDSYHSLYLRDPHYLLLPSDLTNKSRKISHPLILGKLFCKETLFAKGNMRSAVEFVFSNLFLAQHVSQCVEHERSVRIDRGAEESSSSLLSTLHTSSASLPMETNVLRQRGGYVCRVFDSAALLMSCVVIFVGQLKQLMLTVVHWPTTTAFLLVVCRIGRISICVLVTFCQ